MNTRILCVDDEQDILDIVRLNLTGMNYEGNYFNHPKDALESCKTNQYAIILSDVHMPDMSGHDFLAQVKEIQPDAIRINMSSFADLKMVLEALAENQIYDFIEKPVKRDKLLASLKKASDYYHLQKERDELAKNLAEKNEELQSWNEKLDAEVKRKTRELSLRDHLLQHLAGCKLLRDPFAILKEFSSDFFPHSILSVYIKEENCFKNIYCSHEDEPMAEQLNISIPGILNNSPLEDEPLSILRDNLRLKEDRRSLLAYSLNRYDSLLGITVLASKEAPNASFQKAYERLVSLISLLVYDQFAEDHLELLTEEMTKVDLDL